MNRQRVCVLGSTGSIGVNTLDVIARHPERYEVIALSAMSRVDELLAQCLAWRPRFAVMPERAAAARLRERLREAGSRTEVLDGAQALADIAAHPDVDTVMAAIVGAAGLAPAIAAARAGKRLLLANKEAIVVGGALFMHAVEEGGATLLPIDSEHSAIFQCLPEERTTWPQRIDHIVLTMMNKALEVIEARWLFGLTPDQIKVVIHPQSIIHSMVVCRDQSVLAQLGTPDMRVPIAYGLSFPERITSGASRLDLLTTPSLTFEEADAVRFPGLHLSWQALRGAEGSTTVLNAANEIAVDAFLNGRLRFDRIHALNAHCLGAVSLDAGECTSIDGLLALDARVRELAQRQVLAWT
jgi:1-deoxy-D-xylulose-5-phosphate reductoisomerase